MQTDRIRSTVAITRVRSPPRGSPSSRVARVTRAQAYLSSNAAMAETTSDQPKRMKGREAADSRRTPATRAIPPSRPVDARPTSRPRGVATPARARAEDFKGGIGTTVSVINGRQRAAVALGAPSRRRGNADDSTSRHSSSSSVSSRRSLLPAPTAPAAAPMNGGGPRSTPTSSRRARITAGMAGPAAKTAAHTTASASPNSPMRVQRVMAPVVRVVTPPRARMQMRRLSNE